MLAFADVAALSGSPLAPPPASQAQASAWSSKAPQHSNLQSSLAVAGGSAVLAAAAMSRRNRAAGRAGGKRCVLTMRRSGTAELVESAEKCLLNNYGKRNLVLVRGEGQYVFDSDGGKYLDFTAGIAVNCLGHSDEGWAEVVAKQAKTLTHTSNLWLNEEQVKLGRRLTELSFADKAFFCNSGTEANEAAIKFARKFHVAEGKPRTGFFAFEKGFHGRTMGALALTWKEAYKKPFEPLMPSASFLPYNSIPELSAIDESTCAVFVEPMQGEGGVVPGEPEFLQALRKRCDEVGALLIFDEVQCGLGRTGKLFANELSGVEPDIMTLAKPLAAGLPIGAVLMKEKVASCIQPGEHGSTFAGAPLVCAAANYVVEKVSGEAFLSNVTAMGEKLMTGLKGMTDLPVRGQGLLMGVVFPDAASCGKVKNAAQEKGLLVLTAGEGNVMRLAPALTVGEAEVEEALKVLKEAFAA